MTDNEAKDSLPSDKIEEIVNEMTPEDVFNETPTEGAKRLVKALSQQTKVAEYLTWQRVEQDALTSTGTTLNEERLRYTNVGQYGELIPPKGDQRSS